MDLVLNILIELFEERLASVGLQLSRQVRDTVNSMGLALTLDCSNKSN